MPTALEKMGVDIVHAQGNQGHGIKVGIISNGLGSNAAIKGGYDFGKGQALTGISDDPTFISYGPASLSDLLSVAPKAHVYDLKITANGITPMGATVSALDWAAANKMQILVLGFAGGQTQLISEAIDRCASVGIVMFAGVGGAYANSYGVWYPASHQHVIVTSCMDPSTGGSYYYYWRLIDWGFIPPYVYSIAYPLRGSVELTIPWLVFDRQPVVWPATAAGAAALLMADGAKASEVRNILKLTAEKLPDWNGYPSADLFGSGLVRADLSVAYDRTAGQVREGPVLTGGRTQSYFGDFVAQPAPADTIKRPDVCVMARYPYPRNGQTNVDPKDSIELKIKHFKSGVNIDKVKVSTGCEVYTTAHPDFSFEGYPKEYDIKIPRAQPKGYNEPVMIKIEAEDLDGNPGLVYEGVI